MRSGRRKMPAVAKQIMNRVAACLLLALTTAGVLLSETEHTDRVTGEISGKTLSVIQAALPEAQKQHIDLRKYKIVVTESADSYVVSFVDPDFKRAKMEAGSSPNLIEFEVELRKEGLQVIKSYYVR